MKNRHNLRGSILVNTSPILEILEATCLTLPEEYIPQLGGRRSLYQERS